MVIHAEGDEPGLIDVDFDDFYSRGHRRCAGLACVLTGSAVDGDDLVQEAFSTAYRRWSEICLVIEERGFGRGRDLTSDIEELCARTT
jgi:hypothetical protein